MTGPLEQEAYREQGAARREQQIIEWIERMADANTLGTFVKAAMMSIAQGIREKRYLP